MSTERRGLGARCVCRPAAGQRAAWLGVLGSLVLSALVPKCPLCIAGYLALCGLGALAPWAASARPVALGLCVCSVVWLLAARRHAGLFRDARLRIIDAPLATAIAGERARTSTTPEADPKG